LLQREVQASTRVRSTSVPDPRSSRLRTSARGRSRAASVAVGAAPVARPLAVARATKNTRTRSRSRVSWPRPPRERRLSSFRNPTVTAPLTRPPAPAPPPRRRQSAGQPPRHPPWLLAPLWPPWPPWRPPRLCPRRTSRNDRRGGAGASFASSSALRPPPPPHPSAPSSTCHFRKVVPTCSSMGTSPNGRSRCRRSKQAAHKKCPPSTASSSCRLPPSPRRRRSPTRRPQPRRGPSREDASPRRSLRTWHVSKAQDHRARRRASKPHTLQNQTSGGRPRQNARLEPNKPHAHLAEPRGEKCPPS